MSVEYFPKDLGYYPKVVGLMVLVFADNICSQLEMAVEFVLAQDLDVDSTYEYNREKIRYKQSKR